MVTNIIENVFVLNCSRVFFALRSTAINCIRKSRVGFTRIRLAVCLYFKNRTVLFIEKFQISVAKVVRKFHVFVLQYGTRETKLCPSKF